MVSRYLLLDFFTAREFDRLDTNRRRRDRAERRRRREHTQSVAGLESRIDELEDELGQAILLLRSISELALDKGLVTSEELGGRLRTLDKADGVADGKTGFDLAPPDQDGDGDE